MTGRLERKTGALNVVATHVDALLGPEIQAKIRAIKRPGTAGEKDAARKVMGDAADLRAVAPVGINFGRRGR